jgi:hypothetical protein
MTEDAAQTFGRWKLVGAADVTGKRAVVRCSACGCVRTVSFEALTQSHVNCSGCSPPLNVNHHAHTFASDVACSESRSARKKHYGMKDA